jgi:hypothetical protein
MKRCLFLLVFLPFSISAQIGPGPRITALGSIGAALQDTWSIQSNPAGIASIRKVSIATSYESEYFNPDLSRQSVMIILPHKKNVYGINVHNYGFSVFNEQRVGFAYAKIFGEAIFAALSFNYHLLSLHQYGSADSYSFELGLQYRFGDNLFVGAHIANPNASKYNAVSNALIPVYLEFGASYRFTNELLLNTGVKKYLNSSADFAIGLEYSLAGWLAARGGVTVNPFMQFAGFGYSLGSFRFDAATSSHSILGYSPQIGISYEF